MAKYYDPTKKQVIEVGNPALNPELIAGKTLVSPQTSLGMITGDMLKPAAPIKLPEEPKDTTNYKGILASLAAENPIDIMEKPASIADFYAKQAEELGLAGKEQAVIEAQKQLDLLNAQMRGLTAEAQATPIRLQEETKGRGITKGGLAPIQAGELRKIALKALPLQSQILAQQAILTSNQNMLKLAQDKLDTMFRLKSDDADRQYNYQKDIRSAIFDYLTEKEKQQLDKIQKEDDRKYKENQDRLKLLQDWAKTAILNGQSELAAEFAGLEPDDPDFKKKLAEIQVKIKKVEKPASEIQTFKQFFPNVDLATKAGRQQYLNWKAQTAAAGKEPGMPKNIYGKNFSARLGEEVTKIYSGNYGTEGARERAIQILQKEFPQIDVAKSVYERVPDDWEKLITTRGAIKAEVTKEGLVNEIKTILEIGKKQNMPKDEIKTDIETLIIASGYDIDDFKPYYEKETSNWFQRLFK